MKNFICNDIRKTFAFKMIVALIFLLLGAWGLGLSFQAAQLVTPSPKGINGVLDLSKWDLSANGIVNLDGEWDFYWERLLQPADFRGETSNIVKETVYVPNQWNQYTPKTISANLAPSDGYATYRLVVLLQQPYNQLAIKLPDISTAYTLWVNGKLLCSAGTVGRSKLETIPQYLPQIASFEGQSSVEIIIQVANFSHHKGGIKANLQLGTEKQIAALRDKKLLLDVFLFGVFSIMACYHMGLYYLRQKDKSPLYFSIICIVLAIRTVITGEFALVTLFPEISWELLLKVEYLSYYVVVPIFARFFYSLYRAGTSRRFLLYLEKICFVFCLLVLFTDLKVYSKSLMPYNLITLITGGHLCYVLLKEALHKQDGAKLFAFGMFVIMGAVVNDILVNNNVIYNSTMMPWGLLIFILLQSFVLSIRFTKAFTTVEKMTMELRASHDQIQEWNRTLEQIIARRTASIKNLMNNAGQGFLSYGCDLLVQEEYSAECTKIFGFNIKAQNVAALLFADDTAEQLYFADAAAQAFAETDLCTRDVYLSLLPTEANLKGKTLQLEYRMIRDEVSIEQSIMIIVTDITTKRYLETKMDEERRILRMVVRVSQYRRDFISCVRNYNAFCSTTLPEMLSTSVDGEKLISDILYQTHTFKGNFSQLSLDHVATQIHSLEEQLLRIRQQNDISRDLVIDVLSKYAMSGWLEPELSIIKEYWGNQFLAEENIFNVSSGKLNELENMIKCLFSSTDRQPLLDWITKLKSIQFVELLSPYAEYASQLAAQEEKLLAGVTITGGNFFINPDYYSDLKKALVHVFRNSIFHGLECPDERIACGKPAQGNVDCTAVAVGGRIILTISDDGRGIDIDRLRAKTGKLGRDSLQSSSKATKNEVLNAIFQDGVSTNTEVSELAGLGIGLSSVKIAVEKLGGTVQVTTAAQQGTTFVFDIPLYT